MKIIEALKDNDIMDVRVSHGRRWLVVNGNWFTVYGTEYYKHGTRCFYDGTNEDEAVEALLNDD